MFFLKGVEGAGNNQCAAYSLHFHCLGIKLARRNKPGTDCHKQNDSADNNIDMRYFNGLACYGRSSAIGVYIFILLHIHCSLIEHIRCDVSVPIRPQYAQQIFAGQFCNIFL